MGVAAELATSELDAEARHVSGLRASFMDRMRAADVAFEINGSWEHRLPHNLHIAIPGIEAARILESLAGVAISAGSACSTERREASHVLRAMGLGEDRLFSSLRLGFGRSNTAEQVARAADEIIGVIRSLSAR
jgi:cysteine desulfurase